MYLRDVFRLGKKPDDVVMTRVLKRSQISYRKFAAREWVKYHFSQNIYGTIDLGKWVPVVL